MSLDTTPARPPVEPLVQEVEAWLRSKYTTHADGRQKGMGLSYITAETKDLAKEIAGFVRTKT